MKHLLDRTVQFVWTDRPICQRGTVIVAIPVICLFASLIGIAGLRDEALQVRRRIDSNKQILQETNQLLKTVVDAETGIRGYGLTKQREFLEPYLEAKKSLTPRLAKLKVMVQDNQLQTQQFEDIKKSSEQQIIFLQNTLKILESSEKIVQSPARIQVFAQGKLKMDNLREKIDAFADTNETYQNSLEQQLQDLRDLTNVVQIAGLLVGCLGAAASWYLFYSLEQELRQREAGLQESKTRIAESAQRFRDTFEQAAVGMAQASLDGKLLLVNQKLCDILGYSRQELIEKKFQEITFPEDLGSELELLNQLLAGKIKNYHVEKRYIGQDGELIWGNLTVSLLREQNGNQFLMGVVEDIRKRKQAEESLRLRAVELNWTAQTLAKTTSSLRKRNLELDQFAYVVSHDLKAPLRAIANLSSWIEEDLSDSMTEDTLHQMNLLRGRVHRMEALIEGLLQYSRIGRMQLASETVKIDELLAEIIDSLAPPSEFEVKVEPGMPTFVTERLPLQQVFANLISNAIKHNRAESGYVKISVKELDDFYEFSVTDNGPGIAPQYHDKVFVIFQTLEARDKVENTGIGLSLVKKIVEGQGGSISLESAEGEGATFGFTWPKQPISKDGK